jgi:hypothetical protein
MQIKDIITEAGITDPEGWRNVQINYGDDPKMLDQIKRAAMMPKITSWDQAVDKASAMMQQQNRRDRRKTDKPDREFGTANMKLAKPTKKADPDAPKKTRGAQLGNQNAFKGGPGMMSAIGKTISSIKDFGKDGYVSGVKDAMSSGGDLRKSVSDRYTKLAKKPNQSPKDVFNS